jgi:tetrahydromethanopterin S-methyltransferase subunit G
MEPEPEPVTDENAPAEALKDVSTRLSELGEYVSYYLTAKVDGLKATGRNIGIYAALGVVGLIAASAMIMTLVVLTFVGIAHGIGDLLWDKWWLGDLITGVLFLTLLAVGAMIMMKKLTASSRERTVKKYAARQQQERTQFGTDVQQRAQDPAE